MLEGRISSFHVDAPSFVEQRVQVYKYFFDYIRYTVCKQRVKLKSISDETVRAISDPIVQVNNSKGRRGQYLDIFWDRVERGEKIEHKKG